MVTQRKGFTAPTPELQQEFELELGKELGYAEKYYQGLTPQQKVSGLPKYNLDILKIGAREKVEQRFQTLASTEELRLQIESGRFQALPPAVSSSYLKWKQHESDVVREEAILESNIRDLSRVMESVGAPTALTKVAQFVYKGFGSLFVLDDPRVAGEYEKAAAQYTAAVERLSQLSVDLSKTKVYQSMYEGLAAYIQSGRVTSYEDLFTLVGKDGNPITVFKDIGEDDENLRQIFDQVTSALLGLPAGTSTKELSYQEMIAELAEAPKGATPAGFHKLTVDAIIKQLTGRPVPALPSEYPTIEEVLDVYNKAGVPDELADELGDLETYVSGLEGYWEAISANKLAVSQGLEEAKLPEIGIGQILLQTLIQPALTALDLFAGFYNNWVAPWGGFLYRLKSHEALDKTNRFPSLPAEREFMRLYNEARLTDDWWHAGGYAFANTKLGFLERLLFEWYADPTTWLGSGIGKALTTGGSQTGKFGKFIGPIANMFDVGYAKALDALVFDRIKNVGQIIPKTPFQLAIGYAGEDMKTVAAYLVRKADNTYYSKIPVSKATDWLKEATNWAVHHPEDTGLMAQAGKAMLRRDAMGEGVVRELGKKLGSELDVTRDMVLFVNTIAGGQITGRAGQLLTKKTTPVLLLRALGIAETNKNLRLASKEINRLFQSGIQNSNDLLDRSKHVPDLLANLFNRNHGIYLDIMESSVAHNLEMSGRIASTLSRVDWTVMHVWRNTFDRWVVTPGARMYLAFSAYGPGNILEGYIKQMTSKQIPFNPLQLLSRNKPTSIVNPASRLQRLTADLSIPLELKAAIPRIEMAGEVVTFKLVEDLSPKGREILSKWRSALSGGPIGKFFIDKPGMIGLHQRADYYRKMFLETLGSEAPTVMSNLANTIDDAVKLLDEPTLKALNISRHELKEILLERAINGPSVVKSFLDDIVADRLLVAEDAVKSEARKQGKKIGARKVSADQALSDRISGGRVAEAVGRYPLVPDQFGDDLLQSASDGSLWLKGGKAIDDKVESYIAGMYDYFVHTPEFYKTRLAERVDGILAMEARTREEYIGMLEELQELQRFYGSSTDDTVRAMNELEQEMSKRLKVHDFNEWRAGYTVGPGGVYEGLADYAKQMRESLDSLENKLRLTITKPESMIDWDKVTFSGIRFTPELQEVVKGTIDLLPINIKFGLKGIRVDGRIKALGLWNPNTKVITLKSIETLADPTKLGGVVTLYHEIFHSYLEQALGVGGNWDIMVSYAKARGIDLDMDRVMREVANLAPNFPTHPELASTEALRVLGYEELMNDMAEGFAIWSTTGRAGYYETKEITSAVGKYFNDFFPKTQRTLPITDIEKTSIGSWLTAWIDEQKYLADWWSKRRTNEAAEILNIKALHGEEKAQAWTKFKQGQMKAHADRITKQSQFKEAMYDQSGILSEVLGVSSKPPPFIDVSGRRLTKLDVASLSYSHPSQMGQAMLRLETMTLKPKHEFISEVKSRARRMAQPAGKRIDQLGWTDESIGEVYDEVLRDMYMSPGAASVIEPHLMELKALKDELWSIYNTKGLAKGTADGLQGWLDDLADGLENVPGYAGPKVPQAKFVPIPDYDIGLGERVMTAPPARVSPGLSGDFLDAKQRGADRASKEYYKDWADYTNENGSTALMRTMYPFWTYELHRMFWLPRATIRTPGLFKAWGSYMDMTEDGYVHIPGTSLEINPLRGTIFMGGMIRLIRKDYPEYYDRFPGASEYFDFFSRFGFYPATYLNFLKIFGGKTAQGKTNFGELLPAWVKTPLNAYIAIHPDSVTAKNLLDTLLAEPFRDYTTILIANAISQRERKTFNGVDINDKLVENLELTTEEREVWTKAVQQQGWMGAIMEQAGVLRIRTEEQIAAWEQSGKLIEEMSGLTLKDQLWIRRHGFRVGDYAQLDPLEQGLLGELDAVKYHSEVFSTLMPSTWQEEDRRRREFFDEVRGYSDARKADQLELDSMVRSGGLTMGQWNSARSELSRRNANFFDDLSETERYRDVAITMEDTIRPDGSVREGMITRAKDRSMLPPVEHPAKEILNLYYSIELEKKVDLASGNTVDDWDGYFQRIDTIVKTLQGANRADMVEMITNDMTELVRLRWEIYRKYFRGYNRRQEAILSTQFSPEEQVVIRRWIFGTPAERDIAREVVYAGTGNKLISYYQSLISQTGKNLRLLSPELDAWLQFFEVTDTTLTDEATRLYSQYRKEWGIPE